MSREPKLCNKEKGDTKNTLKQHTPKQAHELVKAAHIAAERGRRERHKRVARPVGLDDTDAAQLATVNHGVAKARACQDRNHAGDALEVARAALACMLEEKCGLLQNELNVLDLSNVLGLNSKGGRGVDEQAVKLALLAPRIFEDGVGAHVQLAVNLFPSVTHRLRRPENERFLIRLRPSLVVPLDGEQPAHEGVRFPSHNVVQ